MHKSIMATGSAWSCVAEERADLQASHITFPKHYCDNQLPYRVRNKEQDEPWMVQKCQQQPNQLAALVSMQHSALTDDNSS